MTDAEPQRKILLVEDDPSLAMGLCDALEFEGYQVAHAKTGAEGVELATRESPDCIILDLMLPDMNGYQICEHVRRLNSLVPIIMLTARSQEADKIRGLEVGADDYVTKPFSVGELIARIRALFRRVNRTSSTSLEKPIEIGSAFVHFASQEMISDGRTTPLSFYETELLRLLHDHVGQPVRREDILERVWGIQDGAANRAVDNVVVKLRKKLEPQPEKPHHILTVYGIGYKLVV